MALAVVAASHAFASTEPIGLDALFDIDRLPVLRSSEAGLVSSYNRRSWNDDDKPEFLRIERAGKQTKNLVFYAWADGERVDDQLVEAHVAAGEWRHVAVTWTLSDERKLTKCVYVDGALAERRVVDDWSPAEHRAAYPREADDRLFVGSQIDQFWLSGALDDVRLYDHALSSDEIAAIQHAHGGTEQGLLLCLGGHVSGGSTLSRIGGEQPPSGPGGRGLAFADRRNMIFAAEKRLTARQGTFAAWINPAQLVDGRFQHLFCLGADLLGLYLSAESAGGEGVLADLKGPGCIYRVWLGGGADRMLHFYFDGERSPRLSLRFSGQHGEPDFGAAGSLPLTSGGVDLCYPPMMATGVAGGSYLETGISFMPMPFRNSCKITMEPAGNKYVQVNYKLYPAGTKLSTFDPHRLSERDRQACRAGRERWFDPAPCAPARGIQASHARVTQDLAPGQSATLFQASGAGRITGLWARIPDSLRTEAVLRGLRMRIFWDGEITPAVDTALGPFFNDVYGTPSDAVPVPLSPDIRGAVPAVAEQAQWAFGLPREYRNLLFGFTRDRGYYCYFPMPYAAGARIELENSAGVTVPVQFEVQHEEWKSTPADLGRFHALYHRDNPTQGIDVPSEVRPDFTGARNHVILDTGGRGHYIGASLFFRKARPLNPEVEKLVGDICEGNEMIFVDEDSKLTMIGTGSEDYMNQNYWVHDHVYPYDGSRLSYDACYRLQLADCVPFQHRIRVTIEHGAGNAHYLDYSSVAYWYQAGHS
jgi:hypothetical protein